MPLSGDNMDATTIETILDAGKIGDMPFSELVGQNGPILNQREFLEHFTRPLAKALAGAGVVNVRWELPAVADSAYQDKRCWKVFLVLTLAPSSSWSLEVQSRLSYARSTSKSLKFVHDLAVQLCRSYFYQLKGDELWIEYQVARTEITANIEATLESGRIGDVPFPMWFKLHNVSSSIKMIAHSLAARGVVSVRWAPDEDRERRRKSWKSYLVVTLPASSFASPPSLPSAGLVQELAMILHNAHNSDTKVTETDVELWVPFEVNLPLDQNGPTST